MHRGKEIIVIQKPTRNKVVWYYYYYYTDDGVNFHASNRYSVGLEVDIDNIPKSKRKAERIAKHLKFKKEQERKEKQTRDIFSVYTKDWFIWGVCPFTSSEEKRGRSLSQGNTENNRRILEKYILPTFKNLKLSEITPAHIENWMFKMQKTGLSGRSINRYYTPLQTIFREATRLGDLTENPCTKVKSMIEKEKVREILTMQEYNRLFKNNTLSEVWNDQLIYYTMAFIGATCGVRIGELQALRNEFIDLEKLQLHIHWSWRREIKTLGPVKGKESRIVPITTELANYIVQCRKINPFGFIFSFSNGKQPVDHKAIGKFLKRALEKIGIEDEERKARGLEFHSLRHFANSYFNDNFEQNVTMKVIGHSTKEMNLHYDHATKERLGRIREAMERMG